MHTWLNVEREQGRATVEWKGQYLDKHGLAVPVGTANWFVSQQGDMSEAIDRVVPFVSLVRPK